MFAAAFLIVSVTLFLLAALLSAVSRSEHQPVGWLGATFLAAAFLVQRV